MKILIFLIITYCMGAIPTGVWLGKFFKNIDVRNYGSKNSGATNSYRVLGWKLGLGVLIGDILKGFLPLYIASKFIDNFNLLILLGLIAILAHTYSVFINFKGGKGVATTVGVFLFLAPKVILLLFLVFVSVLAVFRYVSLSSVISAIVLPIAVLFLEKNIYMFLLTLLIGGFVVYRHKTNIDRLVKGTEEKFKF
ncbi:MAG: glycerol-3-phosphate 1-O-acyltransferase PlsY [Fusobacterium sp.]|nr:glycerol-3-phosphate 1-O-acyltransferase PlsY [Fusobacterium sp.]